MAIYRKSLPTSMLWSIFIIFNIIIREVLYLIYIYLIFTYYIEGVLSLLFLKTAMKNEETPKHLLINRWLNEVQRFIKGNNMQSLKITR